MSESPFTRDDVRRKWDDFTESEIVEIGESPQRLVAALQDKFGLSEDEAARSVTDFCRDDVNPNPASNSRDDV